MGDGCGADSGSVLTLTPQSLKLRSEPARRRPQSAPSSRVRSRRSEPSLTPLTGSSRSSSTAFLPGQDSSMQMLEDLNTSAGLTDVNAQRALASVLKSRLKQPLVFL